MGWLTQEDIIKLGFSKVGKEVLLSDKASYYGCSNIKIGDYTRIDDFCILSAGSGGIFIGRNVHIAAYTSLIGQGNITLEDFSGLSSRVSIYSSNDDYSGSHMTNPTVAQDFTNVCHKDVRIRRHAIVGSGTVILPGVTLEEGAAVGALSLVTKNCKEFGIYIGVPAKHIKDRNRNLLEMEKKFLENNL